MPSSERKSAESPAASALDEQGRTTAQKKTHPTLDSSIVRIIEKTLNYVDGRLMDHGKRVAYLTYKILKRQRKHSDDYIRRVTLIALLHDIGAYKTEEIDRMVQFETEDVWTHSVYGYLFIKYFSPLKELAPVILFHHANCAELTYLHPDFRQTAQIIYIADRFDILSQTGGKDPAAFKRHFDQRRNRTFSPEALALFFHPGWEQLFDGMEKDEGFQEILYREDFSEEEVDAFIEMLTLSIDFRSPQTVTHTFTSTCVCKFMSNIIDIDPEERRHIATGVMFHDLGKVGVPYEILEKPGRLSEAEMEIMRQHVSITEDILSDFAGNAWTQLAIRHHEKLNGMGYPKGLTKKDLTMGQRLVAVADIFSALCSVRTYKDSCSKEETFDILNGMVAEGLIDPFIVATVLENYESLLAEIKKVTLPIMDTYRQLRQENDDLLQKVKTFADGRGNGEISA